ncbi:MAG: hypothetical protein LC751_18540 [Actinobacteria bacterium]|nr:hypothetical protein [Actinomycetota bacterium]MCA1740071.1 hypothetical protein [Actinomycetota bacterium]
MMRRATARAVYGASLLLAPGAVIRITSGESADRASVVVGRALGLRHLAQALIIDRNGTRDRLLIGAVIDATHALSMAGLAASDTDHRWLAVLDAALAGGWTINGIREARNA